eukprot:4720409-Pleurochrysis_carterae.AAC.1
MAQCAADGGDGGDGANGDDGGDGGGGGAIGGDGGVDGGVDGRPRCTDRVFARHAAAVVAQDRAARESRPRRYSVLPASPMAVGNVRPRVKPGTRCVVYSQVVSFTMLMSSMPFCTQPTAHGDDMRCAKR